MRDILHFTLVMGGVSSLFDFATFALLLYGFEAPPDLFRTAWFVESTATQILVIFIIRTTAHAWTSRAHPVLTMSSLAALMVAFAIVFSPLARLFGFVGIPLTLLVLISGLVAAYLAVAEVAKRFAGVST